MQGTVAVFIDSNKPLEIRQYPVLEPENGNVRLVLETSGICGTDLHILNGRLGIPGPMILGHEFIGKIDAIDSNIVDGLNQPLKSGDMVIACVAVPCGKCFSCRRGEAASCLNFGVTYFKDPDIATHFWGGYSEFLFSPSANLVKVPSGISIDAVAAFPCAGPTIIRACEYAGGLNKDELVVIQGTGPVGLFAIAWAASVGCNVIAIGSGTTPYRMKLAESFGAGLVLDYKTTTVSERMEIIKNKAIELNRGDGADVVIEASGASNAFTEGINLLRTRGKFIIPGQYSSSGGVVFSPELITFRALQLIGSGQYTIDDIGTYLKFILANPEIQEKFASVITHRYTVDNAISAMTEVEAGNVGKAIFIRK